MRRGMLAAVLVVLAVSLPVFWLFRPPDALPARFTAADCARVALRDSESGRLIFGIEDMALVPGTDRLVLAATDRLGLGDASEGGLYQVSVDRLAAGQAWAESLIAPGSIPGGLYPQGIAISDDGERLALVNRAREGGTAIIAGALFSTGFTPRHERRGEAFCRANDLDFSGEGPWGLRVTLDRASCGAAWADLRPGATTGRVITVDPSGDAPARVEVAGLAFANGIAGLWVAETRAGRLHNLLGPPMPLPGGPDNLSWGPNGGLVVALHPSLVQVAAYLHGLSGAAPSRIVRVTPGAGVEVLFDDPHGALISAATVAVLADDVLIAGSAGDAGVLVCRESAA